MGSLGVAERWNQDDLGTGAFMEDRAEAGDNFGAAVSYGDFNGDLKDDLAVGVPGEDLGGGEDAGAVNIIYGSSEGLEVTEERPAQFWHQSATGIADAPEPSDGFGSALAMGDFNGDAFSDLAIGVAGEGVAGNPFPAQRDDPSAGPGIEDAGAVHVLYGSVSGLSTTEIPSQFWHQNSVGVNEQAEPGEEFGFALAAGNFGGATGARGEPRDDLAIGVPGEELVTRSEGPNAGGGAVNVIYGSASGLSPDTTPDQLWSQGRADVTDEAEAGDRFGYALAAANFGGAIDPQRTVLEDLAVGVPFEDLPGTDEDAGAVNVIYGSVSGLSTSSTPDQFWHQNSPDVEDEAEGGPPLKFRVDLTDHFGWSLAAADFGGGPGADRGIGVPGEDLTTDGGVVGAGAANVIYGSSAGLSATATPDQFLHQVGPPDEREGSAPEDRDHFGWSLGAAKFGSGPFADLVSGVPDEDLLFLGSECCTFIDAGMINVSFGTPDGLVGSQGAHDHTDYEQDDGVGKAVASAY